MARITAPQHCCLLHPRSRATSVISSLGDTVRKRPAWRGTRKKMDPRASSDLAVLIRRCDRTRWMPRHWRSHPVDRIVAAPDHSRLAQIVVLQRQRADALASGGKNRIAKRRRDDRRRRLAAAASEAAARHHDDFDLRHLGETQHWEVVEVRLLPAPILDGDLAVERRRETPHDPTFRLLLNGERIDR